MIHSLKPRAGTALPAAPPQRRRVIIVGAGPTGMSAAFHMGEHSLLLDRRSELEEGHDHQIDFPLGAARARPVGVEDGREGGERPDVSAAGRKALFISCGSRADTLTKGAALIHVTRWQPPTLTPAGAPLSPPTLRILAPLLRGELRLDSLVVRVNPSERLLELEDGARFIYDKMISTIPLAALACLVMHELPGRIRHDASLRYWLQDHDIEVADRATRELYGDVDEFAAGKHVVERIMPGLTEKFRRTSAAGRRHSPLFQPRLVGSVEA